MYKKNVKIIIYWGGNAIKLCFINKVWEKQVQIINLINTSGDQSVINKVINLDGFSGYV